MRLFDGLRVLDISDDVSGAYCTKFLSDFGAEVIVVERPGGNASRLRGPFYHDTPHPEYSLHWLLHNVNKKSITLNLESADGRDIFKRLVKTAHFLVECYPPGYMANLGLGYDAISEINPSIIMTSITPFGQSGPYEKLKGPSLIVDALSGHLVICGEEGRPPVPADMPLVEQHSGAYAFMGIMIAHYHRVNTGDGQYIDVSMQESSTVMTLPPILMCKPNPEIPLERSTSGPRRRGTKRMYADNFRTKDGWVFCYSTQQTTRANVRQLLDKEGLADDLFDEKMEGCL